MCGRITIKTKSPKVAKIFQAKLFEEFNPHFNIAPTARIPVVQYDPEKKV
jgi:putative SOS response-associated peptidase YedK